MLRKIFFEYNKPSMLLYTYKKQKKKLMMNARRDRWRSIKQLGKLNVIIIFNIFTFTLHVY